MTRKDQIREHTVNLLLDRRRLDRIETNDIESFVTLLYQSEYLKATGNPRAGNLKTEAHLFALEHLNISEDDVNQL